MPYASLRKPEVAGRALRRGAPAARGCTLALLGGALALLGGSAAAQAPEWPKGPQYALALGARPKYPANFTHFDYADPRAPKGGTLTLPADGGFDTLNPFTLKGRPAALLSGMVFESLTDSSLDEPFTGYGLLARTMEVAKDGLSMTYTLRPEARFSDGHPVTAEDVVFSFAVLRGDAASPFFRFYYKDVQEVEAVDAHTVRLRFARSNRELPMITGQLPILPKHVYGEKDFGADFSRMAVGSGPYRVGPYEFGKYITYERDPKWWGRNLPINVGRANFDTVSVKYYRDETVRLEALKAGEFDFLSVNIAKQWAVDVRGDKWDKGWILREELPHSNTAGMQGFAFNLRREIFQDRRVRKAISLAFDFEWSNRTLFYGQYKEADSYFANSELAARGLPSPAELALLKPFQAKLPPEVFTEPVQPLNQATPGLRERLRLALRLLDEAGWKIKDGVATHAATGRPLRFVVTLVSPAFQRVVEPYLDNLRKIGVQASMRVVDDAVYERQIEAKDFDMIVHSFPESQSPGNEQLEYWGSESANQNGSRNVIGIRNPAVDALVEHLIKAHDRATLLTATHALDRVLWHEHYMVPQWYVATHRIAYWNRLSHPARLPLYYNPQQYLMWWWYDSQKAAALSAAMAAGKPVTKVNAACGVMSSSASC
jgi:microcin C transport system substrate-binding protein